MLLLLLLLKRITVGATSWKPLQVGRTRYVVFRLLCIGTPSPYVRTEYVHLKKKSQNRFEAATTGEKRTSAHSP